jgi:hypothetical protein
MSLKSSLLNTGRRSLALAFANQGQTRITKWAAGSRASINSILDVTVRSQGRNFTAIPDVVISGDGAGATAVATMYNGEITKITVTNGGMGYTFADVTLVPTDGNGTDCVLEPLIGPAYSMTAVVDPVASGTGSIRYHLRSEDEIQFILTLDQSVGNFYVGNIMLFDDTDTPFMAASLDLPAKKEALSLPATTGNSLRYVINLKYTAAGKLVDVTITPPDNASLPLVATEAALPPVGAAPYDAYQIERLTKSGLPTVALRDPERGWYGVQGVRNIDDPGFDRVLDGGVSSRSPYIETLGGGSYRDASVARTGANFGTYASVAGQTRTPLTFGTYEGQAQ